MKGGIRTVEVPTDTPSITFAIEEAVKELGDEMYIGAETVLNPETAKLVPKMRKREMLGMYTSPKSLFY
ncbi:hypothetical protein [Oceanobacillus sp. FSL H7-0719]|uniref:hypothetical protein n=1 Tax=Oceanobacillus sp. FSL H7-0719 TaxID=2954507 RepID=UPI00324B3026